MTAIVPDGKVHFEEQHGVTTLESLTSAELKMLVIDSFALIAHKDALPIRHVVQDCMDGLVQVEEEDDATEKWGGETLGFH